MKLFAFLLVIFLIISFILKQDCQTQRQSNQTKSEKTKSKIKMVKKSTTLSNIKLSKTSCQTVILSNVYLCPNDNHPHMIDLDLPSRTKWACCNVGSIKPEDYGNYYAWGEIQTKLLYDWCHYEYFNDNIYRNLGSIISGTQYDIAFLKWSGKRQMPTKEQYEELINNCSQIWIRMNGIKGRKFTSLKNGKSIFFPAAGLRDATALNSTNIAGLYWTGTQHELYNEEAYFFNIERDTANTNFIFRGLGLTIRPVSKYNNRKRNCCSNNKYHKKKKKLP